MLCVNLAVSLNLEGGLNIWACYVRDVIILGPDQLNLIFENSQFDAFQTEPTTRQTNDTRDAQNRECTRLVFVVAGRRFGKSRLFSRFILTELPGYHRLPFQLLPRLEGAPARQL